MLVVVLNCWVIDTNETPPGRLAEPAVLNLLKPVTEGKDKQVAADPRRFSVVEPSPFAPQFLEAERTNAIDLALDRSGIHRRHG
jgi:hypothetical protein